MLNITGIFAIFLFISSFGGSVLFFLLKKNLIDPSAAFSADLSGCVERAAVTTLYYSGGEWAMILIPAVILVKSALYLAGLRGMADILSREQPSLSYQKVRVKANMAVDLILSPAFAILVGMVLRSAV